MTCPSRFSRRALTACALIIAGACAPAMAQNSFTVDEGTVPGSFAELVTADRISFNYQAKIVQSNDGGPLNGDLFTESGFLTKASFADGGSAVPSQLNGSQAGTLENGYGIYGLFDITGTASQNSTGGITATFTSATLTLYIDPDQNTTLGFAGNIAARSGVFGEDYAIATYTLLVGEAHVFPSLANGDFDTILNMTLTPAGQAFFASPNPFYTLENFGGNTQTITGASFTAPFVADVTGAGTELFLTPIPEPETYALMLAGLAAVGFIGRRRKQAR